MSVRRRHWTSKGIDREAWVCTYTDASGMRRLKTFKQKKQADQFEHKVQVQVSEGTHVADSASITVEQAAKNWITAVTNGRNGRRPAEASTLRQYQAHVDLHIVPHIGELKLSKLNGPRVATFRDHLLGTISRALARKVLTSFKSILKEAQARGDIVANPAAAISIHGSDGRHKEKLEIPERAEIGALLDKLDELATQKNAQRAKAWRRYRVFITIAIYTGLRASELRGLPWAAVDLNGGTIEVRQRADENGTIGPPKTEHSRRTINLPSTVVPMLREWKAECPPGALALPNWQGGVESLANIHSRAWKPVQVAAGVTTVGKDGELVGRYNFHALRHFRASHLIADGANAKEVMAELGHGSITVTYDVYGSLFRDEDAEQERRERANRMAAELTSARQKRDKSAETLAIPST